jgi:putative ABC transport system substrate-binding protein
MNVEDERRRAALTRRVGPDGVRRSPRRAVLKAGATALLLAALPSLAQQTRLFRIGWIAFGRSMGGSRALDAFRAGLRDLGYVEGRNVSIVERWSDVNREQTEQLAKELVESSPDLIVTVAAAVFPVVRAGAKMPIVFAFSGDPVVGKLVDSFAHPGRNLTGLSFLSLELVGKRMQLLKETLPALKRMAIIANPQHPGQQAELAAARDAAGKLGLATDYFQVRNGADLEQAFAAIPKSGSRAIVVFPDALTMSFSEPIAAFAARNRVPAISGWAHFAERGNLLSYGPRFEDSFRRLATYVDKVRKGVRPADLPVELPTKFELVINMKTAAALGITIPPPVLVRADRVIE